MATSKLVVHDLLLFLYVCEEGSFTAAAERYGCTQPYLAKRMTIFESAYPGTLTRNPPKVTELGYQVKPHIEAMWIEHVEAHKLLRPRGPIVLGFSPVGREQTARAVKRFRAKHPKCAVEVCEVTSRQAVGRLRRGEIDIVAGYDLRLSVDSTVRKSVPGVKKVVLVEHPRMLVIPADIADKVRHSFDALRELRWACLARAIHETSYDSARGWLSAHGLLSLTESTLEAKTGNEILGMVVAQDCFGFLPAFMKIGAGPDVEFIELGKGAGVGKFCAFHRDDPRMEALVAELKAVWRNE